MTRYQKNKEEVKLLIGKRIFAITITVIPNWQFFKICFPG